MFCQNCGVEVTLGSAFCQNCGVKAEIVPNVETNPSNSNQQPAFTQHQPAHPPLYNSPPAVQHPVANATPMPVKKQKKRHLGLWIFLSILVLSIAGITYLVASAFWLGPKDLGIKYTQKDFNKVIQELDIHMTADLGNGNSYDNTDILNGSDTATGYFSSDDRKTVAVENVNYDDFNWEFSKYEKKAIKVTDVQATAFFNEMGMSNEFLWLSNTQIKIEPDGSVKLSAALNVKTFIRDLFQSIKDEIRGVEEKIKISLPEKLNIYLEGPGEFAIINNKVSKIPPKVSSSIITVPEKYLTDENGNKFISYFTDLFAKINLNIDVEKFYVENGEFYFEGTVPTEVRVTPKNAD